MPFHHTLVDPVDIVPVGTQIDRFFVLQEVQDVFGLVTELRVVVDIGKGSTVTTGNGIQGVGKDQVLLLPVYTVQNDHIAPDPHL